MSHQLARTRTSTPILSPENRTALKSVCFGLSPASADSSARRALKRRALTPPEKKAGQEGDQLLADSTRGRDVADEQTLQTAELRPEARLAMNSAAHERTRYLTSGLGEKALPLPQHPGRVRSGVTAWPLNVARGLRGRAGGTPWKLVALHEQARLELSMGGPDHTAGPTSSDLRFRPHNFPPTPRTSWARPRSSATHCPPGHTTQEGGPW